MYPSIHLRVSLIWQWPPPCIIVVWPAPHLPWIGPDIYDVFRRKQQSQIQIQIQTHIENTRTDSLVSWLSDPTLMGVPLWARHIWCFSSNSTQTKDLADLHIIIYNITVLTFGTHSLTKKMSKHQISYIALYTIVCKMSTLYICIAKFDEAAA